MTSDDFAKGQVLGAAHMLAYFYPDMSELKMQKLLTEVLTVEDNLDPQIEFYINDYFQQLPIYQSDWVSIEEDPNCWSDD